MEKQQYSINQSFLVVGQKLESQSGKSYSVNFIRWNGDAKSETDPVIRFVDLLSLANGKILRIGWNGLVARFNKGFFRLSSFEIAEFIEVDEQFKNQYQL